MGLWFQFLIRQIHEYGFIKSDKSVFRLEPWDWVPFLCDGWILSTCSRKSVSHSTPEDWGAGCSEVFVSGRHHLGTNDLSVTCNSQKLYLHFCMFHWIQLTAMEWCSVWPTYLYIQGVLSFTLHLLLHVGFHPAFSFELEWKRFMTWMAKVT